MYFTEEEKKAITLVSLKMICADGKVEKEETDISFPILKEIGVESLDIAKGMSPIEACSIISRMTEVEKKFVAAFLGVIMAIDGDVDEKELTLWQFISSMCNLPSMSVRQAKSDLAEIVSKYM